MISMETSSFLCLLHRHANAIEAASATFDHNSQQHIKLWRDCSATTTAIEANQPLHLTAIHDNITNRDRSFNKCSQPRSRPQHKGFNLAQTAVQSQLRLHRPNLTTIIKNSQNVTQYQGS
jgi:hypothetical protein